MKTALPQLSRALGAIFKAPAARKPDTHRNAREAAKILAAHRGIEIESLRPGFNVWPPAPIADTDLDEFLGDHYCNDWAEVYSMVQAYAQALDRAAGVSS